MRGSIGLKIFGLVALLSLLAATIAWVDLAERCAAGLAAIRRRAWSGAEAAFRRCLKLMPDGGPSSTLLTRLPSLAALALPEDWSGAWQLAEK